MIDIEFRIGGQKISFDKGSDEMEAQVLTKIRKYFQRKLEHVRCPEHGGAPRVVAEGPSLGNLEVFIHDGCCQKLIDEVENALVVTDGRP